MSTNQNWKDGFNRGRRVIEAVHRDHSAATLTEAAHALFEGISLENLPEQQGLELAGAYSAFMAEVIRLKLELEGGTEDVAKLH